MVTEYEARKLQHDLRSELDATPADVWKCAAGLLVIVMVTLVGTQVGLQQDGESKTARLSIAKPAAALGAMPDQRAKHLERVTDRD